MIKYIFLTFLGIGLVSSLLLPDNTYSSYENRMLQTLPTFSTKALFSSSYTEDLDAYCNDQFPFRNSWIAFKTSWDKNFFKKNCIEQVYLAQDNYLIHRYTQADFSEEQIDKNIAYTNAFINEYNATLLLIPSASQVLTDYLPWGSYHMDWSSQLSELENRSLASNILYHTQDEYIYYRTDHHWTLWGAYLVYQELVETPLPYEATTASEHFLGSTYRKINYANVYDTIVTFATPNTFHVTYDDAITSDSLYSDPALATGDQYVYYLDGNHGLTLITNETVDSDESILIVKDSFGNSFATLLANHYETTHLIDLRHYNGRVSDYIEKHEIDHVIMLYSEINFMQDTNLIKL
ncbi:MAG: DHHW family protein [Eubacteriales bacterium]